MDFVSKEAKGYIKEWGSTINGEEINNSRYCRIVRCCKKQGFPLFEWGSVREETGRKRKKVIEAYHTESNFQTCCSMGPKRCLRLKGWPVY